MGHVGTKTRSLGQILEKPFVRSRGHIFNQIIINLVRIFVLMKSGMNLKMGHVRSKTRSLGHILEKQYICSMGHIFSLTIMKLDQHVCLDEISHEVKNGSKTRSISQIL